VQGVDVVHGKALRDTMAHSISVVGAHFVAAFDVLGLVFAGASDRQILRVKILATGDATVDYLLVVLSGVAEERNVAGQAGGGAEVEVRGARRARHTRR
jgi:hypothetical protein